MRGAEGSLVLPFRWKRHYPPMPSSGAASGSLNIHSATLCASILNPRQRTFPDGLVGKESDCNSRGHRRCRFTPWVRKIPREGSGAHYSILADKIPQTEESGGLQSVGSLKSQMQLSTHTYTHMHNCGFSCQLVCRNITGG